MEKAGIIAFLIGLVCVALSLTYVTSSALLLFGMIIGGGGGLLLYLAR